MKATNMEAMKKILSASMGIALCAMSFPAAARAASREPVRARHGMVVSVSEIASRVGVETMRRGGNAIDAAVAVGLALAVTWPEAGNIGGGGFMLIRRADGRAEVIDYRERAPLAATGGMYLDKDGNVIDKASSVGYRAVGVPGTVAGLALALKRHGKLSWQDVVEPARRLAAEGFPVSQYLARGMREKADLISKHPETRRIFIRDGKYYEEGERFAQPELAATLARMKKDGPREFYEGETARLIAKDMKENGGLITARDLKEYEPTIREPLRGNYRGYEILTVPPPSSGGIAIIQTLNMLERHDLKELGFGSSQTLHLLIECLKRAFADRSEYVGDPDFGKVPVKGLISKKYAEELGRTIDPDRATPSESLRAGKPSEYESTETTHFTVADPEGNIVSNTYTINELYGSGVTARGTGILLNNEMDDFTAKPGVPNTWGLIQTDVNAIRPRKRPVSSMTPTMVLKDGKPYLALGSPGGATIISCVLQVIINVLDFDMDAQQAVDAPRFHHQWFPDKVRWEPFGINRDARLALEKKGHVFNETPGYTKPIMGDVHIIMIDPKTNMRVGAADPRRGGVAQGF
jgi:gamma-glutamyltranspeptidase/glutathione hydrolase